MSGRRQWRGRGGLGEALASERDALERYVRGLGATPAEAEDVAATAFLRAVETGQDFSDASAMAAWLRIVARNDWIDAQRRRMRQRAAAERGGTGAPAPVPSAEECAEADERARALLSAIAQLPPTQRTALSLQLFEGLSYVAIAERLGITVPAVTSLLHRARTSIAHARRRGLLALAGAWPARWLQSAAQVLPGSVVGRAALPVALVAVGGLATDASLLRAPPRAPATPAPLVARAAAPARAPHLLLPAPTIAPVVVRHRRAQPAPAHRTTAHRQRGAQRAVATPQRAPQARSTPPEHVEQAGLPAAPASKESTGGSQGHAQVQADAPPEQAKQADAGGAPEQAKQDDAGVPSGQAEQADGGVPPGQAKKADGGVPPGQAKKADGGVPPGQAKKADGGVPPGQAKKADGGVPPGQAKQDDGSVPPGQGKQDDGSVPPGQAKKDAAAAAPSEPPAQPPAAADPPAAGDPAQAASVPDPPPGGDHVPPGQENDHGQGDGGKHGS